LRIIPLCSLASALMTVEMIEDTGELWGKGGTMTIETLAKRWYVNIQRLSDEWTKKCYAIAQTSKPEI
jgi:hypothetical protein